jgi:hypoxanthine-guanine phosphoribosyltransferase
MYLDLTGFGGKDVFIVEDILNPGHDIIDLSGCGEVDALSILVDPRKLRLVV